MRSLFVNKPPYMDEAWKRIGRTARIEILGGYSATGTYKGGTRTGPHFDDTLPNRSSAT